MLIKTKNNIEVKKIWTGIPCNENTRLHLLKLLKMLFSCVVIPMWVIVKNSSRPLTVGAICLLEEQLH